MAFFKRKQLLIIPEFQFSFLRYTVGIALIVSLINYSAIKYFFYKFYQLAQDAGIPTEHIFYRFVSEQETVMTGIMLVSSTIICLFLILYGLYYSNKIAGPIYNIQMNLKKISTGESQGQEIKFRKGDYFHELATTANEALKIKK